MDITPPDILNNEKYKYIVACQSHPALVKIAPILAVIFHFNDLLVCIPALS